MVRVKQPVYLLRHGESEWKARGVTQGQTPHPRLTKLGRAQMADAAESLARRLSSTAVVGVTSSDLTRAVEGGEVVAARLRASHAVDERLRERHFGLFQGTSHRSTVSWTGRASAVALAHGGVEPRAEVMRRTLAALADLDPAMTHVVVAHGELFRSLPGGSTVGEVANGQVLFWDGRSVQRL
ncbi:histidine phosphatase family protein [Nocardioides seonyuensis]|uniref:Histidine phosphatase family protein n=1 Tax=Nocardioides seonyuensis TaxID=2518371 RepID=A0A4P7IKN0_9ACTN|nr:histidine phosphatase family protein [Nocardioides seonyuensis]QBX56937.1 histidine phosphatase family protein [Nocardioides seonyuensis]